MNSPRAPVDGRRQWSREYSDKAGRLLGRIARDAAEPGGALRNDLHARTARQAGSHCPWLPAGRVAKIAKYRQRAGH